MTAILRPAASAGQAPCSEHAGDDAILVIQRGSSFLASRARFYLTGAVIPVDAAVALSTH